MTTLITPLPTPPTRQDSSNFNDRADEFLGALPLFQQEANALAIEVQSSADEVEIARQAVVSTANVTKWISGTTYSEGVSVWSPINGAVYRKMTSTTGGTTDPSLDSINYKSITDSNGVIYTPAGTGAVATNVQEKLRESVSVMDFIPAGTDTATTDCTAYIQAAIDYIEPIGGTIFFPKGTYLTSGGHEIISSRCVRLVGDGEKATHISHTGNNICFWFKSESVLQTQDSGIYSMSAAGGTGTSAKFIRISDGWGQTARKLYLTGYNNGTAIELYNYVLWTEGTVLEDIMIRNAKYGIQFNRSGLGNDTNSYNGFTAVRVNMALAQDSAKFIYIPSQLGLDKVVYGCDITGCKLWFESTNGRGFDVQTGNMLIGRCTLNVDGIPATNSIAFAWNAATIDLQGEISSRQSIPSVATTIKSIIGQETYSLTLSNNFAHPLARIRGQIFQLSGTIAAGTPNGVCYYSDFCPPYSSFRVTLSYRGGWFTDGSDPAYVNQGGTSIFFVQVNELDRAVYVTKIAGPADAATTIGIRPVGGATPGAPGGGTGLRWDVYANTATAASALTWSMDVEML